MTETASDTTGQTSDDATPARPTTDDADTWKAYWRAQGMPWRIMPEISAERQAYLTERRAIEPDIEQGIYPFKGVEPKLTRADIEWLLATHESKGVVGPVIWEQEKDKSDAQKRSGLNLIGADLSDLNLQDLPLACMLAGIQFFDTLGQPQDRLQNATTRLTGTSLSGAKLQGANFVRAQLTGAFLQGAELERADLRNANLDRAGLRHAHLPRAWLHGAHLNGAFLEGAHLEQAGLEGAQLEEAFLEGAQLEYARLRQVQMSRAILPRAHLSNADLHGANLAGANLREADLADADLHGANLADANLHETNLAGANLSGAQLEHADLGKTLLRGANLSKANLKRADLRGASFDKTTQLNDATLRFVSLDQTIFDNTNLSVVRWQDVPILGDELRARVRKDEPGKRKSRLQRVEDYQAAARAYRRLAVALQTNGMNDEADTYRYRAQLMQRRFHWHSRRFGRWSFSALLALLAGYGYKPARAFLAYALVIAVFTGLFMLAGLGVITFGLAATQYHELPWYEALVLSVASFHGRGFFQPVQSPGDPIAILAAIEAVFGLFIEVTFIATFTQRFFGK